MEMADLTTWQKNTSRCDEKSLISLKWNWNLHSLEAGFEAHNTALAESLSTLNLAWKEFENYWRASKISDTTASLSSLTNKTYLLPIKKKQQLLHEDQKVEWLEVHPTDSCHYFSWHFVTAFIFLLFPTVVLEAWLSYMGESVILLFMITVSHTE